VFFQREENKLVIINFLNAANNVAVNEGVSGKFLERSLLIIQNINDNPKNWDDACAFNIENIGESFINHLNDVEFNEAKKINKIYVMAYRLLCELALIKGGSSIILLGLNSIKNEIANDSYELGSELDSDIKYASYSMQSSIIIGLFGDDVMKFKNLDLKVKGFDEYKIKWDKEIFDKEVKVDIIKDKLNEYEHAFNFVGLYKGFSSISKNKNTELNWSYFYLIIMGFLVVAPLIIEILFLIMNLIREDKFELSPFENLIILLPVISLEVILIYFFRIILQNHRSLKTQIIQLELRKTLCQFIQSYADYSSDIKEKDASALEKFENLIFSGLISNSEKLPSSFDGMDQIGNLMKAMKGKG